MLRNVAVKADRSLDGVVENATWTTGRMIGKHALLFQNPSDYVQINLPQQIDDLTLAAWINVESINADYAGLLMSDGWNNGQGLSALAVASGRSGRVCRLLGAQLLAVRGRRSTATIRTAGRIWRRCMTTLPRV